MSEQSPSFDKRWLREGQGLPPTVKWSFRGDGAIVSLGMSRESCEVFVCDASSTLYRLTKLGKIAAVTHPRAPFLQMAWSDDGQWGYGVDGDRTSSGWIATCRSIGNTRPRRCTVRGDDAVRESRGCLARRRREYGPERAQAQDRPL